MNQVNQSGSRSPSNYKIWNSWFLCILLILIGWYVVTAFQLVQAIQILYDVLGDVSGFMGWDLIGEIGVVLGLLGIIRVKKWGYLLALGSFLLCIVIHLYYLGETMSLGESTDTQLTIIAKHSIAMLAIWILIRNGKATINGINPFKKVEQQVQPSVQTAPQPKPTQAPQSTQPSITPPSQKMSESSTTSTYTQPNKPSESKKMTQYRNIPVGPAPWEKNTAQMSSQSNYGGSSQPKVSTQSSFSKTQTTSTQSAKRVIPTTPPSWEKQSRVQNTAVQPEPSKTKEKTFSAENPMGSRCVCGATLTPNQKFCAKCGRPV